MAAATNIEGEAPVAAARGYLGRWRKSRSTAYLLRRSLAIGARYGITTARAERRVRDCVSVLGSYDCRPSFPTPGTVVDGNARFCEELQQQGVELAVHGYDHVDFTVLTRAEARDQLERARDAFARNGIHARGYRCPYLSWTEDVSEVLPRELRYSSNRAIWWDLPQLESIDGSSPVFQTLRGFYSAESSRDALSVPELRDGVLEIPASLPDDLQLYDGLRLGADGVRSVWTAILEETHRRGELFTVLFHPESWNLIESAVESLLATARRLRPAVWIARLRDIDDWWRAKAQFQARLEGGWIEFDCAPDATVLVRGAGAPKGAHEWFGGYVVLPDRRLRLTSKPRPFVGVADDVSERVPALLREQGYILEVGARARECGVVIDAPLATRLGSDRALVEHVESSQAPLVRFWRWPRGHRSALSLTGDLDALSLRDYALRFVRI